MGVMAVRVGVVVEVEVEVVLGGTGKCFMRILAELGEDYMRIRLGSCP